MRIIFCVFSNEFSRLDKYLSKTLNLSRRKVKHFFNERRVLLNRKKAKKSDQVKFKDIIEVEFEDYTFDYSGLEIVKETDEYLIIYKPERFHSQEIFKNRFSVENFLKQNFGENVKLLNRLDFYSQGFLIASKTLEFYHNYKKLEEEGKIKKYYLTFVEGRVKDKFVISKKIDTKKKKVVKVLEEESDIVKTEVEPFAIYENFSIVIAKIFKGARHQIRAHLSYLGHPLIGDAVYGKDIGYDYFLYCFGYECIELGLEFFEFKRLIEKAKRFLRSIV